MMLSLHISGFWESVVCIDAVPDPVTFTVVSSLIVPALNGSHGLKFSMTSFLFVKCRLAPVSLCDLCVSFNTRV